MKNIFLAFFYFFAVFSNAQKNHVSIYVDQSTSVTIDKKKLSKYLRRYMVGYLKGKKTATVEVKLIFDNTASLTNTTVFEFTPPVFRSDLYSEEQKVLQRRLHKARVQQYTLLFIKKTVDFILQLEGKSNRTEILEILVPLSRLKHPSTVLIISDMIQESAIANLAKEKVENEAQIVALANQNVQALKQKYTLSKSLKDTNMICVMPVPQSSQNALYGFLESYWTKVFTSFGITTKFEVL